LQSSQHHTTTYISGIIVIKGQNLTRSEQVEFTSKLGSVIVLPPSFEGKDPEPHHPAIQRVTNFWASGKWKGATAKFGAYWHQDGQFWVAPKHNILSILHAQATPPTGGEVRDISCVSEYHCEEFLSLCANIISLFHTYITDRFCRSKRLVLTYLVHISCAHK